MHSYCITNEESEPAENWRTLQSIEGQVSLEQKPLLIISYPSSSNWIAGVKY